MLLTFTLFRLIVISGFNISLEKIINITKASVIVGLIAIVITISAELLELTFKKTNNK